MDNTGVVDALFRVAFGVDQARHAHWRGEQGQEKVSRDTLIGKHYAQESPWGMEIRIDLGDCHPTIIGDAEALRAFALACSDFLQMHPALDPVVVSWGVGEPLLGLSLVQMMDTGVLSGHVMEQAETISLTLFSGVYAQPYATALFCQEWFEAQEVELAVTFRGFRPSRHHPRGGPGEHSEGGDAC